jgi:hypothetical protein
VVAWSASRATHHTLQDSLVTGPVTS